MKLTLAGYDTTLTQAVPVNFRAGQTVPVSLTLPKFGTITGVVEGNVDGSGVAQPVNVQTEGNVVAVPSDVLGGAVPLGATNFGATPTVSRVGNGYTISGPPGYYTLTVSHPQFQPQTAAGSVIPVDNFVTPVPPTPGPGVSGVFRIVNDRPNTPAPFKLEIIRGKLDLSVFRTLSPDVPLGPGATAYYRLFDVTGATPVTAWLPVTGGVTVVDDLYPIDYQLQIREFEPLFVGDLNHQVAFPVITSIRINKASMSSVPSTTTVKAPLPPLRPTVVGSIVGKNSLGGPVLLPPTGYAVTSTFAEPSIVIGGTSTVPNPAQGDAVATVDALLAGTGSVTYSFSNVPAGVHQVTLTATPPAAFSGYTLDGPTTRPMSVTSSGVVAGPAFEYSVKNVDVQFKLSPGDYPGMTGMTLKSPTAPVVYPLGGTSPTTATFDDNTDTITFTNVAPGVGTFLLSFKDACCMQRSPTGRSRCLRISMADRSRTSRS